MSEKSLIPSSLVPRVVDDEGNPVTGPEMEKVTTMVMQMAQLANLARIRKSIEREHVKGEKFSRTLAATDHIQRLDLLTYFPHNALATATFHNYGPNTVYIDFNNKDDWTPIRINGEFKPDYTKADRRIEFISYRCNPGETASVQLVGKY